MRIFNRVIAAGTLVVSTTLGASGVAVADVTAGSSVLPIQLGAPDEDHSEECDDEDGGLFGILGGGDRSHGIECGQYDNRLPG